MNTPTKFNDQPNANESQVNDPVCLLQMNQETLPKTMESGTISLHVLLNSLGHTNKQYLLPVVKPTQSEVPQVKQLLPMNTQEARLVNEHAKIQPQYAVAESLNAVTWELGRSTNVSTLETFTNPLSHKEASNTAIKVDVYKRKENEAESKEQFVQNYIHIKDRIVPPRAIAVLPSSLQIRRENVIPRRTLPMRVRFGPVQGVRHVIHQKDVKEFITEAAATNTPIFLLKKENDCVTFIDVTDKDKSNWLSLLPVGDQSTANVWLYEDDNELYGLTTGQISPPTSLCLGYSKKYAEDHELPTGVPILDISEVCTMTTKRQWWCYECQSVMASAALLQRHMDVCHRETKQSQQPRYRCKYCRRPFSRLFTLRRHILRYCDKKKDESIKKKLDESINIEATPNISFNTTNNVEENRLPSDESLQNYTSNLDFSTSLFDTDRISNLDISGSSRSDEFNPYSVGYKDNSLTNDLGFEKLTAEFDSPSNSHNKSNTENVEKIMIPCVYCNQSVVKGKQLQHVKSCPARRLECVCGRVFTNKQKLAQHLYYSHNDESQIKKVDKSTDEDNTPGLICEICQRSFKRRGMLVNHLWRIHKRVSDVPLVRPVRHYPCAGCPKIYRTAAKRDRHVRVHHPGGENLQSKPIEGGHKACVPAECPACPRQYATRAKLLQHMRASHPHLAPPSRKKTSQPQ